MELQTNKRAFPHVQATDIERWFEEKHAQSDFATLSKSEGEFLQAVKMKGDHYLLEYRQAEKTYWAAGKPDAQSVRRIFLAYVEEKPDWRASTSWKEVRLQWIRWTFNAVVVVSLALLIVTLILWARSYRVHDTIVLWRDAVHGNYEIVSEDGEIYYGRIIPAVLPLGGSLVLPPSFWYSNGIFLFGVIPFLRLLLWIGERENRRIRGTACRHCGFYLPKNAAMCPGCGKRYAPVRCQKCGYDLRVTGERCPECGEETGLKRHEE